MKGARRTRKPRQQAGFADLMTSSPSSNSLRGVVTGVSRAQRSNPTTPTPTPTPTPSNPTTPLPPDDDWGALLHTTPKRKFSPQKPNRGTNTPHSTSSRSSSTLSPRRASSIYSPRRAPSTPSPKQTPPPPPQQLSKSFASPPVSTTPPSHSASQPEKPTAVPAFLSGWDGADGWGDDPPLDDSDHETQNDPWGVWPESDDILSPAQPDTVSPPKENASTSHSSQPLNVHDQSHVSPAEPQLPKDEVKSSATFDDLSGWAVEEPPKQFAAEFPEPDTNQTSTAHAASADAGSVPTPAHEEGPREAILTADPNTPGDTTELTAGFEGISGWAVGDPPKQPDGEFLESGTLQTDAARHAAAEDLTTSSRQEAQSISVPAADPAAPGDEADGAGGVDTFSGWVEEEPPQHPTTESLRPDTTDADSTRATAPKDSYIPVSDPKEEQCETVPTTETPVPENVANVTGGFGDFSGWAVEEPPQPPIPEFPEPDAQQTNVAHGVAAEESKVPTSVPGETRPETVTITDPNVTSGNTDSAVVFDTFSGWTVEEPSQQPNAQFPEIETQQTDATHGTATQDNNITITCNEAQGPETVPITEPQIPKDESGATAGFDNFSSWAVEEPAQQPVAESLVLETQENDVVQSSGGQDAAIHVVSKDNTVHEAGDDAPVSAEFDVDASQQAAHIQSAPPPHGIRDDSATWPTEASAQPEFPQTSLPVDPWAVNDASTNIRGGEDRWGWGESGTAAPVQSELAEKSTISENTFLTVSSSTAAEITNTSIPVAGSSPSGNKDAGFKNPVEVACVEHQEAKSQDHDSHDAGLAQESARKENGWELNYGANEVNLDDWGWGEQAAGEAVEFDIGVNSSELQMAGPPQPSFSHVSDTPAPGNDPWKPTGDDFVVRREENTSENVNVNTTAGEPDSNVANAYDATNADFSMYAPNKGNVKQEDISTAQHVGGQFWHQEPIIAEQSLKPSGGETDSSRAGVAEISFNKELFAEKGAAASHQNHQKDAWTTSVGVPDLNVSSSNAGPTMVTTTVPSPGSEHENVVVMDKPGTQIPSAIEGSQGGAIKGSSEDQNDASYMWSEFGNTPKDETDRSWANPDAIWSAPPLPVPSVVPVENENKKDTCATREASMASARASNSNAVGAHDLSSSSFENSVSYPPIEQKTSQHCVEDPDKGSAPSDVMISASGKNSPVALSEKNERDENSKGAVHWQQSLHSNQQRTLDSSGVSDSPQPQNQTHSNSYWTERLDESKSGSPHNADRTAPEASYDHKNAEGYENRSWSPSHRTNQAEATTESAPSYSDAHTTSHEYGSGGFPMSESVTGQWASAAQENHYNGPQNVQWPASNLLHEGTNAADQLEIARKPFKIDRDVSADSKVDDGKVLPSEHSTTDAVTTRTGLPHEWNQYAPRDNSRRNQIQHSVPSPKAEPPRPIQHSAPDSHGVVLGSEMVSADASTYDPFAMYPGESTLSKTEVPYEPFDWRCEPQKASNPQTLPLASSIVEAGEGNETDSRLHDDMSSEAHSSAHNANMQSNFAPTLPTPNVESTVQQPPRDVHPHALQTPNVSHDWGSSDREGLSQSAGKKPSVQYESPGILSQVETTEVAGAESREDSEGILGNSASRSKYDGMRSSVQNSPSSSSGVDVDSYAPRTIASRPPAENISMTGYQDSFAAFDAGDDKPEFPQATASLEVTAPLQTPSQIHVPTYHAVTPDTPASYSMGSQYAPSVPPVPATATADGPGYGQPRSEAVELTSSTAAPEIVPILPPTRSEITNSMSLSTNPAPLGETSEIPMRIENNDARGQDRRDADPPTNSLVGPPNLSGQSLDQYLMPTGTVPEPPQLISDPWSSYDASEVPGGASLASETASTQWDNVGTAYKNADNLALEQMGRGYGTIPDEATNTQGSFATENEPNYRQDLLPPPPQQVSYTVPSYLGGQDLLQAESIVDPSTFSYPYSIMDTEITGDFSSRPQRPLFSWGFGGKLVTVIPRVSAGSEADVSTGRTSSDAPPSPTVHIHDLKDITRDGSNDDWAAASEAIPPVSFPTSKSDLSSYAEMCDRLAKLSVGLKGAEAEGRAALWRVLALRCREGASDWRLNASSAVRGPSSVPMFARNDSSSRLPGNSNVSSILKEDQLDLNMSGTKKTEAAAEVERLLSLGKGMDAVHVAREAGLWSIALVLAATMDRSLYLEIVSGYAKSALHDGSALQTLCLSVAEDESEILRKATSPSGLKEWRKTVGMLLTTARSTPGASEAQRSRSLRLIDQMGEALISQNSDVVAGHVCFMVSGRLGPLDPSNIPLLGADPKLPAGQPRGVGSPAVVLQSLVLEAIENAASGATYPHLLPHRLVLAEEICAVGRPEVALAHCESISYAVRSIFESGRQDIASQCFTLPFLSRLDSLEQRLLVHLGKVNKGVRKGGLTALGKSLSSVFKKGLTTVSRGGQPQRDENRKEPIQSAAATNIPSLPPQPRPVASPPLHPIVSSEHLPNVAMEPNWTRKLDVPALQPQSTMQSSSSIQPEQPPNDGSGNERWNSLVSKTIGFLAPAEGDLSPPLKARNDQGVPFHAQPTPLGLGGGAASRISTTDSHAGHMRSASVGDVPVLEQREHVARTHEQSNYSYQGFQGSHSQTGSNHPSGRNGVDQTAFNGVPVHKTTATEAHMSPTHRRAASDMTFESQTSEKKPPRPPKKSPTLPSGVDLQPNREKAQAAKGWRSRLSEKIRAAFSGPPRAHMGVENKFKYDKERGRWVIEGEDPDESNDEPPPPPEDDPTPGVQASVPFNQSYESLPNPDLGNHFSSESQAALHQSDSEFNREGHQTERARRYSHGGQIALGNIPANNGYSRDTGSESSAASAASAPAPYSSEPTIPLMADPGNKFRAHPGRRSGRRAYIDTFNKGTPPVAMPAAFPNPARPGAPVMNGAGFQAGGAYRIFTPSPVPISHGSNDEGSSVPGNEGLVTSSTVHSNENMYQTHATPPPENGSGGASFGNDFKPRAPVQSA